MRHFNNASPLERIKVPKWLPENVILLKQRID